MKNLLLFLLCLAAQRSLANSNIALLQSINQQWSLYELPKNASIEKLNCLSYTEQIQAHLFLVHQKLSSENGDGLSKRQKQNRAATLNILYNYACAARFPVNTYTPQRAPVFIDAQGTHCAVGYLLQHTGHDNIAQAINATQKCAYVHDIRDIDLLNWASNYGFSISELALIQPSYAASTALEQIASGVNGTVHAMCGIDTSTFVIGGTFTQELAGNVVCNNIALASFNGSSWQITPIGSGVNGTVEALEYIDDKVYVGGRFTLANGVPVNNIAIYDPIVSSQPISAMGMLDSTVKAIVLYNNSIFAGGRFGNLIKRWDGTAWQDLANNSIYGNEVNALEVFNSELYFGGDFELPTGALRRNIAKYEPVNGVLNSGFGSPTPVNDLCVWQGELYAACTFVQGVDTCAIAKLVGEDWLCILTPFGYRPNDSIIISLQGHKMQKLIAHGNHLYALGDFTSANFMYEGDNLIDITQFGQGFYANPRLSIDAPIITGLSLGNRVVLGGAFVNNVMSSLNSQQVNRVAAINEAPTAVQPDGQIKLNIYPNPAQGSIVLSGIEVPFSYKVISSQGKLVRSAKSNTHKIDVSTLAAGEYILETVDGSQQRFSAKFVKQ